MKVLFVASGNSSEFDIVPFIRRQGESLTNLGVDIDYFPIKGKGVWGYVKSARRLKEYLKKNPVDIIHAHYTLSGWCAVLSLAKQPVIVSLMGSDA